MDDKDIAIGFLLIVSFGIGLISNLWYSLVVDLLLLSLYSFVKHTYLLYKTEGNYLSRVGMKPAYSLLAISVLSFGILRILYLYAGVFLSKQVYYSMSWMAKLMFYTDMLFLMLFLYLLAKFIFVDLLDFSFPSSPQVEQHKERVVEVSEHEDEEREEEIEREMIKKLPVIIVSKD